MLHELLINIGVAVVSTAIHEWGHAYMAWSLGDYSVRHLLTLDPRVNVSPNVILGELLDYLNIRIPMFLTYGQITFQPENLQHKYGTLFVALAGPLMNLFLACLATHAKITLLFGGLISRELQSYIILQFMHHNVLAFFVNMLPLPDLDGFEIVEQFWPDAARWIKTCNTMIIWVLATILINNYLEHAYVLVWHISSLGRMFCAEW